jgi:hypothetical protein
MYREEERLVHMMEEDEEDQSSHDTVLEGLLSTF